MTTLSKNVHIIGLFIATVLPITHASVKDVSPKIIKHTGGGTFYKDGALYIYPRRMLARGIILGVIGVAGLAMMVIPDDAAKIAGGIFALGGGACAAYDIYNAVTPQDPVVILREDGIWHKGFMFYWSALEDMKTNENHFIYCDGKNIHGGTLRSLEFFLKKNKYAPTAQAQKDSFKIYENEIAMKFSDFVDSAIEYWEEAKKQEEGILVVR